MSNRMALQTRHHPPAETYRVRHVGAPLQRENDEDGVAIYEFLFEVSGTSESSREPWCIQKGQADFDVLHGRIAQELPTIALPMCPALQNGGMRKMFRQEATVLQDFSRQFETYLNTLLAAPKVQSSEAVFDFCEIPLLPAKNSSFDDAASVGAEAAHDVIEGSSALAIACRVFCAELCQAFHGGSNANFEDSDKGALDPVELIQRRREALLSRQNNGRACSLPPQRPAREINLPMDCGLVEWRCGTES